MIEFQIVVRRDVASFGEAERTTLANALRNRLECQEPDCQLTLRFSDANGEQQQERRRLETGRKMNVDVSLVIPVDNDPDKSVSQSVERQARDLQRESRESPAQLSNKLGVDVVEVRQVHVQVRPANLVVSSPASPANASQSSFTIAAVVFIVLSTLGTLFFVATRLDVCRRKHRQADLLFESKERSKSVRSGRRSTVAEMRLKPDGTVQGNELVVHEDRGVKQELWAAI